MKMSKHPADSSRISITRQDISVIDDLFCGVSGLDGTAILQDDRDALGIKTVLII